jgi:hypothetical protein
MRKRAYTLSSKYSSVSRAESSNNQAGSFAFEHALALQTERHSLTWFMAALIFIPGRAFAKQIRENVNIA